MSDLVGNPEDRFSCVEAHLCVVASVPPGVWVGFHWIKC